MSIKNKGASRREFVQGITTGAMGLAAVGYASGTGFAAAQSQAAATNTDAVNFVTGRGLMDGSGGNFNPNANVDRATAATAFYRLAGSPSVKYEPVFNDVTAGQRYSDAVVWANNTGLLGGFTSGGGFRPNDELTRQEFAAMMFRYADIKFPQVSELGGFTDKGDISEWAETGMSWSVAREIIPGTTGSTVKPKGKLTRAECAAGLQRFVNIKEDPGNIWVLNPKPTKPPVETTGLAPRVKGGWAGKTLVIMCNYNAHVSNTFGAGVEARIRATLSRGETVRLIYIGDLTVIRYQRTTPSPSPNNEWEFMGYEAFLAGVEAGTIKPDAIISAGGF